MTSNNETCLICQLPLWSLEHNDCQCFLTYPDESPVLDREEVEAMVRERMAEAWDLGLEEGCSSDAFAGCSNPFRGPRFE